MHSLPDKSPATSSVKDSSRLWLQRSGAIWFITAFAGQSLFAIYICLFYVTSAIRGQFADWSKYRQVIDGFVAGDLIGNIQFGLHVLMAAILTIGGTLQLVPALRQRFKAFHRWNGRLVAVTAVLISLGGLWLVWVRGSRIDMASGIGISLNAILLIYCVTMAVTKARQRDFMAHQRWAMRAFLFLNGVWFLRVGIMAFGLMTSGVFKMPASYVEGFFPIWSFGSYLVPIAMYELYARAKISKSEPFQYGTAALFFVLTGLTLVGLFGTTLVMWLPPVRAVLRV